MPLRESKGNMYSFLNEMSGGNGYTWNPIRGACLHQCSYCYVPRIMRGKQGELRLDEKDLRTDLGNGRFIFVGSSTDMWATDVLGEWITEIYCCCLININNTYLFQTKNPIRFHGYFFLACKMKENFIYGTTIETNRQYPCMGKAPDTNERSNAIKYLREQSCRTMITIEPILDFDLDDLIKLIQFASPEWVNIGADSQGHHLPEPSAEKVEALIERLRVFTTVKIKSNLKRITGGNE